LRKSSSVFISKAGGLDDKIEKVNPNAVQPQQQPANNNATGLPAATTPDSSKK